MFEEEGDGMVLCGCHPDNASRQHNYNNQILVSCFVTGLPYDEEHPML